MTRWVDYYAEMLEVLQEELEAEGYTLGQDLGHGWDDCRMNQAERLMLALCRAVLAERKAVSNDT